MNCITCHAKIGFIECDFKTTATRKRYPGTHEPLPPPKRCMKCTWKALMMIEDEPSTADVNQ